MFSRALGFMSADMAIDLESAQLAGLSRFS